MVVIVLVILSEGVIIWVSKCDEIMDIVNVLGIV